MLSNSWVLCFAAIVTGTYLEIHDKGELLTQITKTYGSPTNLILSYCGRYSSRSHQFLFASSWVIGYNHLPASL